MNTPRCQHCGEERLVEVLHESPGGTKLLYCKLCGRESVQFREGQKMCLQCGQIGHHAEGCANDGTWGV